VTTRDAEEPRNESAALACAHMTAVSFSTLALLEQYSYIIDTFLGHTNKEPI
jgi:hypothetical protein